MASLALQLCAFAALTALASAIPISELLPDPDTETGSSVGVLSAMALDISARRVVSRLSKQNFEYEHTS